MPGAMVGSAYGLIARSLLPELGSVLRVCALLGIGALAACTLGAPISTVAMIFERTADQGVTLAVMIAVASLFCRQLDGHSCFTWQLARRGVEALARRDRGLLRATQPGELMRRAVVTVALAADLERLKAVFRHRHRLIFVVDVNGKLYGSIACEDFAAALLEPGQAALPTARDLAPRSPAALPPDDDLETAPRGCELNQEEPMPVVDHRRDPKVIGEVRYQGLALACNPCSARRARRALSPRSP